MKGKTGKYHLCALDIVYFGFLTLIKLWLEFHASAEEKRNDPVELCG